LESKLVVDAIQQSLRQTAEEIYGIKDVMLCKVVVSGKVDLTVKKSDEAPYRELTPPPSSGSE